MKKLGLLLFSLFILLSCSKEDQASDKDLQGKWVLIEMNGNIPDSQTTGSNMDWQEFYQLNSDGTFKKSRERDDITVELFGVYNLVASSGENKLELSYNVASAILGTCGTDLKEYMYLQSTTIFTSTWQNCDGPRLKYERLD